jgi:hypothetical protein
VIHRRRDFRPCYGITSIDMERLFPGGSLYGSRESLTLFRPPDPAIHLGLPTTGIVIIFREAYYSPEKLMQRTICGAMSAIRRGANAYPTYWVVNVGCNSNSGLNARYLQYSSFEVSKE